MIPNTNSKTGIRFGVVSSNVLNSELVDDLMYGSQAKNNSYAAALAEAKAEHKAEWQEHHDESKAEAMDAGTDFVFDDYDESDFDEQKFADAYQCEEPQISGVYEGITYETCWLGGALNFFIAESPWTTLAVECSPCLPRVDNLDQVGEGDYVCYGIPKEWYSEEFQASHDCRLTSADSADKADR